MGSVKKTVVAASVGTLALGGVLVGIGQTSPDNAKDFPEFNKNPGISVNDLKADDEKKDDPKKASSPSTVDVSGDEVKNIREDRSNLVADYCRESSLKPGEGEKDKGNTCVSYPIGEVSKNPVRVAIPNAPTVVPVGKDFTLEVKVEDRFGPLDLNAFTFDKSGKAGDTFLEHPGQLDKDGRPLLHCHLGVSTLAEKNGLPGESYDAAFSGVQGLKGNLEAKVSGLDAGFYRGDVYCSQPGHAPLPTALATNVQAFASFNFQVN